MDTQGATAGYIELEGDDRIKGRLGDDEPERKGAWQPLQTSRDSEHRQGLHEHMGIIRAVRLENRFAGQFGKTSNLVSFVAS